MKWLKMRNKWSYGYNKWEYIPLFENEMTEKKEDFVKYLVVNENNQHSFSDKYRGVEYMIIDSNDVPDEAIQKKLNSLENNLYYTLLEIKGLKENIKILKKLIDKK